MIGVGIVGAGLIGGKRAVALKQIGGASVMAVFDVDRRKAEEFSRIHGCTVEESWEKLIARPDVGIVVVAVPNKFLKPVALGALGAGKHVLAEKPLGRNAREAQEIFEAVKRTRGLLKVGFNHRFHPAIFRAKQLFDRGVVGCLLFIRARYGHGGRMNMEKEWRFDPEISGGGELLDQGVHIIDLARWFAGEFDEVYAVADTKFWKTKVDDSAFVILRSKSTTASFHVTTTNWKNLFSFEVFGELGFLIVEGLGGSYGEETLTVGKRKPEFGVPTFEVLKFPRDTSWEEEWKNFLGAIEGREKLIGDANDGLRVNRIVAAAYESSKKDIPVAIPY